MSNKLPKILDPFNNFTDAEILISYDKSNSSSYIMRILKNRKLIHDKLIY